MKATTAAHTALSLPISLSSGAHSQPSNQVPVHPPSRSGGPDMRKKRHILYTLLPTLTPRTSGSSATPRDFGGWANNTSNRGHFGLTLPAGYRLQWARLSTASRSL